MLDILPVQRGWWSPGLPHYRDCKGTYCFTEWAHMPPYRRSWFDGLSELTENLHSSVSENAYDEDYAVRLPELLTRFPHTPSPLFVRLITDKRLQRSIFSPTGCFVCLPHEMTYIRGARNGVLCPFFSDQQGVFGWHLFVGTDGRECVLVSDRVHDPYIWPMPSPDRTPIEERLAKMRQIRPDSDVADLLRLEASAREVHAEYATPKVIDLDARSGMWLCADSLEEFLGRIWIEGELWRALVFEPRQLTSVEADYLAYLQPEPGVFDAVFYRHVATRVLAEHNANLSRLTTTVDDWLRYSGLDEALQSDDADLQRVITDALIAMCTTFESDFAQFVEAFRAYGIVYISMASPPPNTAQEALMQLHEVYNAALSAVSNLPVDTWLDVGPAQTSPGEQIDRIFATQWQLAQGIQGHITERALVTAHMEQMQRCPTPAQVLRTPDQALDFLDQCPESIGQLVLVLPLSAISAFEVGNGGWAVVRQALTAKRLTEAGRKGSSVAMRLIYTLQP